MKTRISLLLAAILIGFTACSSKEIKDPSYNDGEKHTNGYLGMSFGPNYKYNELMIKDYDEMQSVVRGLIKKSQEAGGDESNPREGEAVEYLGQALKLIFSRPDSDNMVAKLVTDVRRELQGYNAFEDVIEALAVDALKKVKSENAVSVQSTSLVLLENLLAEIRPEVGRGNTYLRRVVAQIRDANIKIGDDVKKDRKLRGMFRTKNPSDDAREILRSLEKKKS